MRYVLLIVLALVGSAWARDEPVDVKEINAAVAKAREFLFINQNDDGSWGNARLTKDLNIYAPSPGDHLGFRAACTSLCIMGLLATAPDGSDAEVEKGIDWLFTNLPDVKRGSPTTIYSIWAHCYSIQALTRLVQAEKLSFLQRGKARNLIELQIKRLKQYETIHGGWAYYNFGPITPRPSAMGKTFITAAILIALHEAQALGIDLPQGMIQRAIRSLKRQQKPDYSYLYGEEHRHRPMYKADRPAGSLGRSQVCNHALSLWADNEELLLVHRAWLKRLYLRGGWLDQGRKRPVPHESWFSVAGYYYYFGYYYASQNVLLLPEDEQVKHAARIVPTLLKHQEKDGSWWDFPLYNYHKFYGTGFALMTLATCKQPLFRELKEDASP